MWTDGNNRFLAFYLHTRHPVNAYIIRSSAIVAIVSRYARLLPPPLNRTLAPRTADRATPPPGRQAYADEDWAEGDDGPSALEAGLAVGAVAMVGAAIGAMVGGIIGYKRGRNRHD